MRENRLIFSLALCAVSPLLAGSIDRRTAFDSRILAAHNRERASLGVPNLDWDARLAADAKRWADHLVRADAFAHSPSDPSDRDAPGENLWAGSAGHYAPEEMVGLWTDEKSDFKPGVFPNVSKSNDLNAVGHYTQLIWRRTARVGCGIARGNRQDVLVCRYSVAGNVIGERPL